MFKGKHKPRLLVLVQRLQLTMQTYQKTGFLFSFKETKCMGLPTKNTSLKVKINQTRNLCIGLPTKDSLI